MDMNDYQDKAIKTAIYPEHGWVNGLAYTVLGMCGEAGELANKVKKLMRDLNIERVEEIPYEKRKELLAEAGDVLWYLAAFAWELDYSLTAMASENLSKLAGRADNDTLHGDGDNR